MGLTAVKAKRTGFEDAFGNYNFGENLEEAIELHSSEVVFAKFKAAAVIDIQEVIRGEAYPAERDSEGKVIKDDSGKMQYVVNPDADVQGVLDAYVLKVGKEKADPKVQAFKTLGKLSLDEQMALLEEAIAKKKEEEDA